MDRARVLAARRVLLQVAAAVLLAAGAAAQEAETVEFDSASIGQADEVGFRLESDAFETGSPIPLRHTAYGDNVSPPLIWRDAPADAQSFALVLDDSDAPGPVPFIHWVVYNIPADVSALPEGLPTSRTLEGVEGAVQGPNGVRHMGYFGPRPPPGETHRYNFRLFALHSLPELPEGLDGRTLLEAIRPHILAETILVGTYLAP